MFWKLRWLGRSTSLRKLAYFVYQTAWVGRTVTISRGPLKGMKWAYERGQQFWLPLGLYEQETAFWLADNINDGDVFFDIGANWGYFSLAGSRMVGSNGLVISIEPIPNNQDYISRQILTNGLSNIKLQKVALSDTDGSAKFAIEAQNANSHLSSIDIEHAGSRMIEEVKVQTMTLDTLIQQIGSHPDLIKCDVEGAEKLVLDGAKGLIKAASAKWIISTHSDELKTEITQIFLSNGYDVTELGGFEHEILCYPPKAS